MLFIECSESIYYALWKLNFSLPKEKVMIYIYDLSAEVTITAKKQEYNPERKI